MDFLRDLWNFIIARKKFWLLPVILILVLLTAILIFSEGSAVMSFIYPFF